jgi:hypothetical protein
VGGMDIRKPKIINPVEETNLEEYPSTIDDCRFLIWKDELHKGLVPFWKSMIDNSEE